MAAKTRKSNIESAQDVTSGSPIRLQKPKSSRHRHPKTVEIVQEINPASGFIEFLRGYAVVGLAVGFIIGVQAQVVVKDLVSSFINPMFTLLFGQQLSTRSFSITLNGRTADFAWGAFFYALVNFLFVIFTIYVFMKIFKLDKLDKPKDKDKPIVHKIIP